MSKQEAANAIRDFTAPSKRARMNNLVFDYGEAVRSETRAWLYAHVRDALGLDPREPGYPPSSTEWDVLMVHIRHLSESANGVANGTDEREPSLRSRP